MPGKVYLIGAGPGDPELITCRGARRLAEADLVLYDALVHPAVLDHCAPSAERVFVGKRAGRASARQAEIHQRMVDAARAGRIVARLKGGDPLLFGRGSEEAAHLAKAGIGFEVVPGVPSTLAATAFAGMSLTHRDLSSSVAYITATESPEKDATAHDWAKLATATQTLVIFMGARKLDSLMRLLVEHGRSPHCPAAVVQWASLPKQRTVVGTVADIGEKARAANIGMPSLTLVGEVVRLRESLRWFDTKPLFGKRVLVSRAAGQARTLSRALRDAGAEPVELPAIRIVPPDDADALARRLAQASAYAWLLFTSENGVEAAFDELARQGRDARALGRARVGAIGPSTADALARRGVIADVVPAEHRGEALAASVIAAQGGGLAGARILLPRAAVARDALPALLGEAGAKVDVVEAYRTVPPAEADLVRLRRAFTDGDIDVATFTSSSTVEHTVVALGADASRLLASVTVASIGPITTETARRHGLRVDLTASEYTVAGLVAALERHFAG